MKFDWTSAAIGVAVGYFLIPGLMGQKCVKKDCDCKGKDGKPC